MSQTLQLNSLRVNSPSGRQILELNELQLMPGETLGIAGPSGAGKTTLLYALAGLLDECSGTIHWGEADILAMTPAQRTDFRARNMGFIFQDFMLFDELDALENASVCELFRPRSERINLKKRAAGHLKRLGVGDENRTVDSFSGGERQRVAVARALANDAAVLLADEPTASLDRQIANRLIDDLLAMAADEGKTLIVVSHDEVLLERLNQVIRLVDGALDVQTEGA